MSKWFFHFCPGVSRRQIMRDLEDRGAPSWFVADQMLRRAGTTKKARKYRGLVIALPTDGLRAADYISQLGARVHKLAASFEAIGRPIILLLCGRGDREVADCLRGGGVLPSGTNVIGWLGSSVTSGIKALALTSNHKAGVSEPSSLYLFGPDNISNQDDAPPRDVIVGCQSVFRGLEFLLETAKPAWQASGVFMTGDVALGAVAPGRLVRLHQELEHFAGPYRQAPRESGFKTRHLVVASAFLALACGGVLAWKHGAALRGETSRPARTDDIDHLWSLVASLAATPGSDLISVVPGTPFEDLNARISNLTDRVLLTPARDALELRLDRVEKGALTATPDVVVARAVKLLADVSLFSAGPVLRDKPAAFSGAGEVEPNHNWWSLLADNGVIDHSRLSSASPLLSKIVGKRPISPPEWQNEFVVRIRTLLETVVGYHWGIGRGPEIVSAGQLFNNLGLQISTSPDDVTHENIRDLITAYATVEDSRRQLSMLSEDAKKPDQLFAMLDGTPLIGQNWLYGLRLKASLELEAALNQVDLSSTWARGSDGFGLAGGYGDGRRAVAPLISLNEDRLGRDILAHIGMNVVTPTSSGLPGLDGLDDALELAKYFKAVRSQLEISEHSLSGVLENAAYAAITDHLFGSDMVPRRIKPDDYTHYFSSAMKLRDMTRAYSADIAEDYQWALIVTVMHELEHVDQKGQNLMRSIELPHSTALDDGPQQSVVSEDMANAARGIDKLALAAKPLLSVIAQLDRQGELANSPVVQRWKDAVPMGDVMARSNGDEHIGMCAVFGANRSLAMNLANEKLKMQMAEEACP